MKALTLTQPHATLVALEKKRIETRSWKTNYRGPLAIHAAKGFPRSARDLCFRMPFVEALVQNDYESAYDRGGQPMYLWPDERPLPLGEIVATCELVAVFEISRLHELRKVLGWKWEGLDGIKYCFELTDQEFAFGDYTAGRYAWMLHNIKPVQEPIPIKGALGLWEYSAVDSLPIERMF